MWLNDLFASVRIFRSGRETRVRQDVFRFWTPSAHFLDETWRTFAPASSEPVCNEGLHMPRLGRRYGTRIAYDSVARKHHVEEHYRGAVQINSDGGRIPPSVFTARPPYWDSQWRSHAGHL
jgi:hypothetical protein